MASKQNFEKKSDTIRRQFEELRRQKPAAFKRTIDVAWSNWGFGIEPLVESVKRLERNEIRFIELHGNRYGADLGYKTKETRKILADHGVQTAGICGMFSADCDLSSNRPHVQQRAIEYVRRQTAMCAEMGGSYLLVVPGAVGRPAPLDGFEFERSVSALHSVADEFVKHGVRAAIEPIRSAEVSFCHTILDAEAYLAAVNHPGIQHINGDLYHMWTEEAHTGQALIRAGSRLVNLHMADSNRCAFGEGQMDLDTILRALYLIGYNTPGHFCTAEPLGPGSDPYPAMYGKPDPRTLDLLVARTVKTLREREAAIKS
jgi:D-psicose/D-tagatose/L-ribulose 3-epimerase